MFFNCEWSVINWITFVDILLNALRQENNELRRILYCRGCRRHLRSCLFLPCGHLLGLRSKFQMLWGVPCRYYATITCDHLIFSANLTIRPVKIIVCDIQPSIMTVIRHSRLSKYSVHFFFWFMSNNYFACDDIC